MLNKYDRAKHIVLFKGKVPELQSKIDRFIKFLKVNDIEYYIASVEDEQSYCSREFDEFVSKPDCVMFSYNNVGTNFLVNQNENLWK